MANIFDGLVQAAGIRDEAPKEPSAEEKVPSFDFADALANQPPGRVYYIPNLSYLFQGSYKHDYPALSLHCENEACKGIHFFDPNRSENPTYDSWRHYFITYTCRHCDETKKIYAISVRSIGGSEGELFKFGEVPPFGPPLPSKLKKMISKEEDWDYFAKGRRCEGQGLGIAAFAYYRRVVENRKNELFDEIYKVAKKLNSSGEFLASLQKAKNDTRFSASVETIKPGFPQALLLNGENPLTLLHSALSAGLHDESDETCLSLAGSIREILSQLFERMAIALNDDAGLTKALSSLKTYNDKKAARQKLGAENADKNKESSPSSPPATPGTTA